MSDGRLQRPSHLQGAQIVFSVTQDVRIKNVAIIFQELGRHIEQAHVRPAAVRNFLHLIPDLAYGKERALASIALLIVLMAVIYQLVLQPYPYNIGGRFFDL